MMKRAIAITLATFAAAASLPLNATSAQASIVKESCTLTPKPPKFAGYDSEGYKLYSFTVQGTCSHTGRRVDMWTQAWEQDLAGRAGDPDTPDDSLGKWYGYWINWKAGETRTWTHTVRMPLDESDGFEELYHRLQIRVTKDGGSLGPLTPWDYSSVVKAPH